MNRRASRIAVIVAILCAFVVGGSFWAAQEQDPSTTGVRQTTNQSSPWWRAPDHANVSGAGPAYGAMREAGAASSSDAGYEGARPGAPQPLSAEPLGPSDSAHLAALMYCGRHPVGPGPEAGTFRNRLPDFYESVCTEEGLPLTVREDKNGDGIDEIFRFVYADDGIHEYYDEDGDGGLDAVTLHQYDSQGRVVYTRSSTGFGDSHETFEPWETLSDETRRYEGRRVTVEQRLFQPDYRVVQVFEGDTLVSEERPDMGAEERRDPSPK